MNKKPKDLPAHWSQNAVAYQIYPLSFKDSNGDGKGDLQGIIEKLDYLNGGADSLGINAVWISPFYCSPMADFGYDVSNFTCIDPTFGNFEIFDRLVSELHKRDIKLLVDYVGNHTSVEHEWFSESRSSLTNPKRDWYVWRDGKPDGSPPNNWLSVFGGSAWEYDDTTKQFYLHSFFKQQPDLNWQNPEVREAMMGVVDFWVEKGVDGFRIDAVQHFLEDTKMENDSENPKYKLGSDDPYKQLIHDHSLDGIEKMSIIGNFINDALEKHPDIFIVGEAYVDTNDLKKFYELCPNGRFAPFNFNLIGLRWDANEFKNIIDEYQRMILPQYQANYVFGNHDISRIATRIGEARSRLTAFLQFTLPGIPFIYYGEELGMVNGVIPHEIIKDFLAKIFKGFHPGRDLERTPMQWDNSPHAGFSSAKPWLPVGENYKSVNVAHQKNDPESMFSLYKSLIGLRKNTPALRAGSYVPRESGSPNVFCFERTLVNDSERLIIFANFSDNIERLGPESLNLSENGKTPSLILSTSTKNRFQDLSKGLELMPQEGYIIRV